MVKVGRLEEGWRGFGGWRQVGEDLGEGTQIFPHHTSSRRSSSGRTTWLHGYSAIVKNFLNVYNGVCHKGVLAVEKMFIGLSQY